MSPSYSSGAAVAGRFPRVSGDEPGVKSFADGFDGFSPRERG